MKKCGLWRMILFLSIPLSGLAQTPAEIEWPTGHTGGINGCRLSDNGRYLVSSGQDNAVRIWSVASDRLLRATGIQGSNTGATAFFSHDSKSVFIFRLQLNKGLAQRYDLSTGKLLNQYEFDSCNSIQLSPDDKYLLAVRYSGALISYEIQSGKQLPVIKVVNSCIFSRAPRYVIANAYFGDPTVYDLLTGGPVGRFESARHGGYNLSLSDNGDLLYRQTIDLGIPPQKTLEVWNTATKKIVWSHPFSTTGLFVKGKISGDNRFLVTTSMTDSVCVWDLQSGRLRSTLVDGFGVVKDAMFLSDPDLLLTQNQDDSFRLWKVSCSRIIRTYAGYSWCDPKDVVSRDGRTITLVNGENILLFDIRSGILQHRIAEPRSWPLLDGLMSNDRRYINLGYFGMEKDSATSNLLWEIQTGNLTYTGKGQGSGYRRLIFRQIYHQTTIKYERGKNGEIKPWGAQLEDMPAQVRETFSNGFRFYPGNYSIAKDGSITHSFFSPSGRYMLLGMLSERVALYNTDSARLEFDLCRAPDLSKDPQLYHPFFDNCRSAAFSKDEKYLVTSAGDVWDLGNRKVYMKLDAHRQLINNVQFSPYDRKVLSSSDDSTVIVWNLATRSGQHLLRHPDRVTYACFSPNGEYIASSCQDTAIRVFNAADGRLRYILRASKDPFGVAIFSPDTKFLVASFNDTIKVFDAENGRPRFSFAGQPQEIISPEWFSMNNLILITASRGNEICFWSLVTGKLLYKLLMLGNNDYLAFLADNHYMGSRISARILSFRQGNRFYNLDQFDLFLNRPDIVLRAIGNPDTALIWAYEKAWAKRLQRSGFKEEDVLNKHDLPVMRVLEQDSIPIETAERQLTICFSATDSASELDRYMVYVNGVPLDGLKGFNLRGLHTKVFSGKRMITLSQGVNGIDLSCFNSKGLESLKERVTVTCRDTTRRR